MIPAKLVEIVFHRLWILAVPVVLVPLLVLALTRATPTYESSAIIWVSSPVGDAGPVLGQSNPYITPAQNQVEVLSDLLSTDAFRRLVALEAGLGRSDDPIDLDRRATQMEVSVYSAGVNLVGVGATSGSARDAQAIVSAVISQYQQRAGAEIQKRATISGEYYKQQMVVVQQSLDTRKKELAEYLRANPKAADPLNVASQDPNYRSIVSQVESQTDLLESFNDSLQGVELTLASAPQSQDASFTLQDPAKLPDEPLPTSVTHRFGLPMVGVLFGAVIAAAYAYFSYRTDHTIRSTTDLSGLPVAFLGFVPELRVGGSVARLLPLRWIMSLRERDFARKTAASISGTSPTFPELTSGESKT